MINFSDFCQAFGKPHRGLKSYTTNEQIAKYFIDSGVGYNTGLDSSYYRKWYKNIEKDKCHLWVDIVDNCKPDEFTEDIRQELSPSGKDDLVEVLGVDVEEGEEINEYALARAIVEQFLLIAKHSGSADNIVNVRYQEYKQPPQWGGYVTRAKKNESKCKTLFYRTSEKALDSFYVTSRISRVFPFRSDASKAGTEDANIISDLNPDEIFRDENRVLLIGMEGIGKTMLIRKLFINCLDKYGNDKLPFLITLRNYDKGRNNLHSLLTDAIKIYDPSFKWVDVNNVLLSGAGIVLMDGLDEISPEKFSQFHEELTSLTKSYSKSSFLITTRNYNLLSDSNFQLMGVMPFYEQQSVELIGKLVLPQDVKDSFIADIKDKYIFSHQEYVTNPMLLTLMAMNYQKIKATPDNRYQLYEIAYDTLLEKHDREDKDDYIKRFSSVNNADDFSLLFKEFCARTCRDNELTFTEQKFSSILNKLMVRNDFGNKSRITKRNVLDDICYKACLMYEKESEYTFLHRSFQEYLFAAYYAEADDERLTNLGRFLGDKGNKFNNEEAFMMLYEMAPDRVEQLMFYPYLKKIYEQYDDRIMFWTYIKEGYDKVRIRTISNNGKKHIKTYKVDENSRINEPCNFLFHMITKINGIPSTFERHLYSDDKDLLKLKEDAVVGALEKKTITMKNVNVALLNSDLNSYSENCMKEDGKPIIFGYDCMYDPNKAISEPDKLLPLQKLIYDKDDELWESFDAVRDYYDELELKEQDKAYNDF
ncbi:MAG: NACHT domain-containing protein [Butyrivibrio sp.]|nr:NACHT domain-containing protein [Butyrivibrio sp.]